MSPSCRVASWVWVAILTVPVIAVAQNQPPPSGPPPDQTSYPLVQEPQPQPAPPPQQETYPAPQPYPPPQSYPSAQPYPPPYPPTAAPQVVPPPPPGPMPYEPVPVQPPPPPRVAVPEGAILDGHLRDGPFLSGPGSFVFILHHTLMGAAGGLATQAVANNFRFDLNARTAMLAGTLIGAGLGFGTSAWWQFNHWIDWPVADYGIVNSAIAGMFSAALLGLFSQDNNVLAWGAFVGAELGGWLTAVIAGGEMPLNIGLALTSGAAWTFAYTALIMAIVNFSGSPVNLRGATEALLLAPGVGAGLMAVALMRYRPTSEQILRADLFGAGVGGVVLLVSALIAGGFKSPTPYVLSLLTSAGAIAAVSIFWSEAAEHPHASLYRDPEKDRPYHSVWW